MMGRFLRFYPGYTDETALAMPWSRFQVLLAAIPALEAEEDLRALLIAGIGANPGDKGQAFRELSRQLQQEARGPSTPAAEKDRRGADGMAPGMTPGVGVLSDADGLLAELQQKRVAWQVENERRQREQAHK